MPRLAEAPLEELFAEAAASFEEAVACNGAVDRGLRFAGCELALRFAGGALAEALLSALAPRIVDGVDPDVTIGLWADGSPVPWLGADVGPRGLVRGSSPDGVSAVYEAGSGAVTLFDAQRSRILHRVLDVEGIPWWERAAPLRPALFFALAGGGRHLVHAGAVGDPDRGAVLLAGAGGSGKTTVALAAVEHGLRYVGDDYVLLEDGTAWNLYRTAKVDAGAGAEKRVVEISDGALIEALPVRAVVVPTIHGGRTRLLQTSGGEALRALAPSTAFQMPFDRGAVLATLAELVRRVPCLRLELGDRPADAAAAVAKALDCD